MERLRLQKDDIAQKMTGYCIVYTIFERYLKRNIFCEIKKCV